MTIPRPRRSRGATSWIAVVVWWLGLHFVLGVAFSIWLGMLWGLFLTVVVMAVGLSDRQTRRLIRKAIDRLDQLRKSRLTTPTEKPLSFSTNRTAQAKLSSPKTQESSKAAARQDQATFQGEALVEIQGITPVPARESPLSGRRSGSQSIARQPGQADTASVSAIKFYGPDEILPLDRGELPSPLVYVVQGTLAQPYEPSLIEFGLPVARSGIQPGQEPVDWSSYRALNSSQRAFYLDWLAAGRRQPDVPRSYVTIYLQGLERRVICDGQDHSAIATELLVLLNTYGGNVAFRRDLTSLLWLTISLSVDGQPISETTTESAIRQTTDWNETLLRYCLATFAQLQWKVGPDLARTIAAIHPRATTSVVHQRHAEKFVALFNRRFQETYPEGLRFELTGRAERLDYVCCNSTLTRLPRSETRLGARQRVALDHPQIQELVTLWGRCTDELKSFDRAHRASDGGTLTTEMWEALPEISREQEHPEATAWTALIQQGRTQFGRPLVAIADLARIKNFEPRGRLTKKQVDQLLNTAGYLRLAIEPDARMLGRNYAWDETVAIFPRCDDTPEDLATYNAASILLRLGVNIAAADGNIDDLETQRITAHLSQQFDLSATSTDRLEHLRFALIHSPTLVDTLEKSLQEKLQPDQRQVVGEFLVGIAVADGVISPGEMKALKRAWQALGLEQKSLDGLLTKPQSTVAVSPAVPVSESIVLDQDRIAQIMQDTQRVAEMLRIAMSSGDEEPESENDEAIGREIPTMVPASSSANGVENPNAIENGIQSDKPPRLESAQATAVACPTTVPQIQSNTPPPAPNLGAELPVRYHAFLKLLITQPEWDRKQLDQVARSQGLMLSGALEAINEWVYEAHNDWLISEDGDEIHVQMSLL